MNVNKEGKITTPVQQQYKCVCIYWNFQTKYLMEWKKEKYFYNTENWKLMS